MAVAAQESKINFNPDWKFIRADPAGAQDPAFDDSSWTAVSLPHTYNDIGTFDDWSTPNHVGEMNLWSGRTWYRKTFTLPQTMQGKKVFIEFEATEVARAGGEVRRRAPAEGSVLRGAHDFPRRSAGAHHRPLDVSGEHEKDGVRHQ